ncbi:hypothetical protein PCE1_004230 [Barthelona sp. PCE]
MPVARKTREWKNKQIDVLEKLFKEYKRILVVNLDTVGAKQIAKIRQSLREIAVFYVCKKSRARVAIEKIAGETDPLRGLLGHLRQNIAFVFTNEALVDVFKIIDSNIVPCPAKPGMYANKDVIIPAGNTGLPPTQTSFFQALHIPTKIVKGAISILADHLAIANGEKVNVSQSALLERLNINPFTIKMKCVTCYDQGEIYPADVLALTEEQITEELQTVFDQIAAASISVGIPNAASVPHMVINAARDMFALALETDCIFKQAEELKHRLDNPDEFAVAAVVEEVVEEEEEEPEPESESEEEDFGFDLFG